MYNLPRLDISESRAESDRDSEALYRKGWWLTYAAIIDAPSVSSSTLALLTIEDYVLRFPMISFKQGTSSWPELLEDDCH